MGFFRRHSGKASYNLLANYNHFMPEFVDLIWIVLLMLLGSAVGSILVGSFMGGGFTLDAMKYGTLISYPLTFIPVMLYASAKSRRNEGFEDGYTLDNNNFGSHKGFTMAFVAIVLTIASAYIIEPLGMLLPEMPEKVVQVMEMLLEGPVWASFIMVSIFAPFFEEWLCRGIILRGMLNKVRPSWAIVISALFFALIHANPWQAVPAFFMGLVFGFVYYKTGSLKLTMLMHFTNNTFALIISNIPSLKDIEYYSDILSPWAYGSLYAVAVIAVIFGFIILKNIPTKEESSLGGCLKIPKIF